MTMRTSITQRKDDQTALDAERRLLQQALARLETAQARSRPSGRLIFGLDLTGSREAGLDQARIATAALFDALKNIGRITMKLAYYRGDSECRMTAWHDDPDLLCRSMLGLACESGATQIARLMQMVLGEDKLSGFVFVGDHCEDNSRELEDLARRLGRKAIPVFIFHECADHDRRALKAKPIFKRMAELSGGAYVEFKPTSAMALKEMLSGVAAFAAGGKEGLLQLAMPRTAEAQQLKQRLLLGIGNDATRPH